MSRADSLLVLDVGNTRLHAAVCVRDPGHVRPRIVDRWDQEQAFSSSGFESLHVRTVRSLGPSYSACLGSVHGAAQRWVGELTERGHACRSFDGGDSMPIRSSVRQPSAVGVDRLAAALAAHRLCGGRAVVVDAGTAITVDRVDQDGVFEGGAILPGRKLCAKALAENTDRLPATFRDDPAEDSWEFPGKDTRAAIESGISLGLPGMVDRLVDRLQGPSEMERFLTGGDAAMVMRQSIHSWRHENDLVLLGLWWAGGGG